MRGLKVRGGNKSLAASGAAMAGLAAVGVFTVACSSGGTGVQDEGAAHADVVAKATPSPSASATSGAQKTDGVSPVKLIMADPKVSERVKADLKPCARDSYPVDTSYGNLTGGTKPDVVVNVLTCGDAVGMGTYVYRDNGERYENVFAVEEPAVYSAIDRGDLVVTKQVYSKGDPVAEPSGEEVTTYHWASGKFVQQYWVRNEFSRAVGDDVVPEPQSTSEN
ncbi:hypothetical protein FBY35_3149 [Streptomyces sp. SLBN-118]|uniref:hypothetical protein n=1 Tax=Streptomyces sp. SLBN-118 TaxID=2768454 RepID=UPI00115363BD|nr:hypothetical protein [Streptomyces sp. SLBN-118]TQK52701.1 hypothetical protein FBY35_3149 [Streptomyces sp. SLBN-118]